MKCVERTCRCWFILKIDTKSEINSVGQAASLERRNDDVSGRGPSDRSAMIEWRSRLDGPNGLILLLSLMIAAMKVG